MSKTDKRYTPEQLVEMCSLPWGDQGRPRLNFNAVEYIAMYPREFYTQDDLVMIGNADPLSGKLHGPADLRKHRNRRFHLLPDRRSGPIGSDDISAADAERFYGMPPKTLSHLAVEGGIPHRIDYGSLKNPRYYIRPPEVRLYLESLPYRTIVQQTMLNKLRSESK